VYVGLGSPDIVNYTIDTEKREGWYYYKTLWAVAPEYPGEVTITGSEIQGPNVLRFNAASGIRAATGGETSTRSELHFAAADQLKWRYGPSSTLIRAEGCYAFRIKGNDFIEWVTFRARA
jgi:hypothetical protein